MHKITKMVLTMVAVSSLGLMVGCCKKKNDCNKKETKSCHVKGDKKSTARHCKGCDMPAEYCACMK